MVKEAEAHAAEDKARKEETEVKNNADSLVYQAEKAVKDFEGKAEASLIDNVKKAIEPLKSAIEANNIEDMKKYSEELTKPLYELSAKMYEQAQPAEGAAQDAPKQDDNVVDADFTVDDEKK